MWAVVVLSNWFQKAAHTRCKHAKKTMNLNWTGTKLLLLFQLIHFPTLFMNFLHHDGWCHLIHSYVHSIFTLTWCLFITKMKYTVKCWLEWSFVCNSSCLSHTPHQPKTTTTLQNASYAVNSKSRIKDHDCENCAAAHGDMKLCRVATHETCRLVARSSFKHWNTSFISAVKKLTYSLWLSWTDQNNICKWAPPWISKSFWSIVVILIIFLFFTKYFHS